MKKLFLMLCVSSLFSGVAYADYMCGSSPCFSEDSCNQETGYCNDCSDEGYGHNAEGKCVRCQDPNCYDSDGCEEDYTYCERCKDGYLVIDGRCEEEADSDICPENCSACGVSGNCAWCDEGYYVENGICKQNPENCSWYDVSGGKCTSCNSEYYLEDGVCKQNPENCSSYNASTGKCTWCNSGYYMVDNGTCKRNSDIQNCSKMYYYNQCVRCVTGYVTYIGECISINECTQKGYIISFGSCIAPNCTSWYDWGTCTHCKQPLYLQGTKCVSECSEGFTKHGSGGGFSSYCLPKNCKGLDSQKASCDSCDDGYYLQDRECVSECKEGYISGTNKNGHPSCFPAELGCGYGEKQVGDECVAREDGEGCGVGFYLKDNLCVSESKGCGDGYLGKDGVCISSANGCGAGYKDMGGFCNRIRYTPAEAAKVLTDDNNNSVTITFKK